MILEVKTSAKLSYYRDRCTKNEKFLQKYYEISKNGVYLQPLNEKARYQKAK